MKSRKNSCSNPISIFCWGYSLHVTQMARKKNCILNFVQNIVILPILIRKLGCTLKNNFLKISRNLLKILEKVVILVFYRQTCAFMTRSRINANLRHQTYVDREEMYRRMWLVPVGNQHPSKTFHLKLLQPLNQSNWNFSMSVEGRFSRACKRGIDHWS